MNKDVRVGFLILVLCVIIVYNFLFYKPINNYELPYDNNVSITELTPVNTYHLQNVNDFVENKLTCTGLSYNPNKKEFYLGNYGKDSRTDISKKPSVVILDDELSFVQNIPIIDGKKVDIQGVSCNVRTGTIWYTDSQYIYEIDALSTAVIKKVDIGFYKNFYPNGILYDFRDDTVWVLCKYGLLLHISNDGDVKKVFQMNYIGQDHLCFDKNYNICVSMGVDYWGDDNFIIVFNPSTERIIYCYRVKGSYAIEGIYIMDNYLYVLNDGKYHEARIKENYINVYKLE